MYSPISTKNCQKDGKNGIEMLQYIKKEMKLCLIF